MFLVKWLQRKRKEFPPTYLHLVGNFTIWFLEYLGLLEILRLFDSPGKRLRFHINTQQGF